LAEVSRIFKSWRKVYWNYARTQGIQFEVNRKHSSSMEMEALEKGLRGY
jgi:hypothetical protein